MERYSPDQLLDRFEDLREIKNLMGRLSADYSVKREGTIYDRYWSRRGDVCLGVNDGWYDGADAVRGYYESIDAVTAFHSELIANAFPDALAGKTTEELHGVGMLDYKPVDTPVIEIAGDRETAKGIWCIRGSHAKITTSGPVAYWEWGWFAVDFTREPEGWNIWHMRYLDEVLLPSGSKWYGEPKKFDELPAFARAEDVGPVSPPKPGKLRERYSADREFTPSPRVPEPYATFGETFSYGMEGGEV
jgi:hypothetical protein